ncbi:MAG: hypothetical protein EZS28_006004 [Streblomastix strix]|uniref:Right handed beta helix domain-containing protein n=1 Tax=Streblomastix strix TaxID=222440 RepID=A0A5J4WV74_9EUKA|nr:MAG: hypothetical protein EZS28_006004 [Streblomastix strix]
MIGQAEIKIIKGGDASIVENDQKGWISAIGGLELRMYGIKIITDQSKITIPIIYIEDSNSLLELNTITFSEIKLSPKDNPKGIVHINADNSQFVAQNCIFEEINIEGSSGNAIRLENNANSRITATITNCQFNNIKSIGDSNGQGGSALFAKLRDQSSLIIDNNCQFIQCISNKGNGGALFIDIDFESEFEFKINDGLIKDCHALSEQSGSENSLSGYGGGIFLTGNGDYNAQSEKLDLHGMKILDNSASNSGQSLFVAMTQLKELCRYGINGQYVKGDYDDQTSNLNELQGIPLDFNNFKDLSSKQIQQQQNHLQYYWSQIVILTGAIALNQKGL